MAAHGPSRDRDPDARRRLTASLFEQIEGTSGESRRRALRNRVIELNMPVAASIARRYFRRGERDDDLLQTAYVGLSKAVARFDPMLHNDFLSYAVPTVTGELKKHFRDHCWMVRPPRRIQELHSQIPHVRESLTRRLGRAPTATDLATELGISHEKLTEALMADGCFAPESLDAAVSVETAAPLSEWIGDRDADYARCERHLLLEGLLGELGPRQREILQLRYVEGWTQERIGRCVGISQMQVSRVLHRLIRDLGTKAAA